jgi:hypothetical protein
VSAAAFAGKGRRDPYEPYFHRCHSAAGWGSSVYFLEGFSFSFFISTKLRTTLCSSTERLSLVERRQRCDDAEILGTNVSVVSRLTTGSEWMLLPPMMLAWEQCGDGFGICSLHGGYPVSSVLDLGNRFAVLGSWNRTVFNLLYYLCHFFFSPSLVPHGSGRT